VIAKQETKQKRNGTKQAEAKRNKTKNASINKKNETNINERYFLHETTIHKMPVSN
jgi:hypothetical protein